MRRKIYFILLILSASANALNPSEAHRPREKVTVNFLYETCSVVGETGGGMIPFFDCESYVYGVLDTYVKLKQSIPKAQRACFPELIPPWKVLEEARSELDSKGEDIAAPALIEAMRKKYPCY
jgi:hypothetical protein